VAKLKVDPENEWVLSRQLKLELGGLISKGFWNRRHADPDFPVPYVMPNKRLAWKRSELNAYFANNYRRAEDGFGSSMPEPAVTARGTPKPPVRKGQGRKQAEGPGGASRSLITTIFKNESKFGIFT
jgi:hypothetical protein